MLEIFKSQKLERTRNFSSDSKFLEGEEGNNTFDATTVFDGVHPIRRVGIKPVHKLFKLMGNPIGVNIVGDFCFLRRISSLVAVCGT